MAASCCHPQPVVEKVNTKLIMAATLTHKPLQWNTHTQTHRNTHCVSVYSRQQKLWWLHSRCHWGDLYWRDSRQNVRVCMCVCVLWEWGLNCNQSSVVSLYLPPSHSFSLSLCYTRSLWCSLTLSSDCTDRQRLWKENPTDYSNLFFLLSYLFCNK